MQKLQNFKQHIANTLMVRMAHYKQLEQKVLSLEKDIVRLRKNLCVVCDAAVNICCYMCKDGYCINCTDNSIRFVSHELVCFKCCTSSCAKCHTKDAETCYQYCGCGILYCKNCLCEGIACICNNSKWN